MFVKNFFHRFLTHFLPDLQALRLKLTGWLGHHREGFSSQGRLIELDEAF